MGKNSIRGFLFVVVVFIPAVLLFAAGAAWEWFHFGPSQKILGALRGATKWVHKTNRNIRGMG